MIISDWIQTNSVLIVLGVTISVGVYFIIQLIQIIKERRFISLIKRRRPVASPLANILIILGLLFFIFIVFNASEVKRADWAEILLLGGLVTITAAYASSADRQASASAKMAEEMKEQRVTASRPVVVQQAIYEKDIFQGSISNYFSHFEAYNKGNGPAIEVEISLLDNDKNQIESHRKSFLGVGEPPIEFRPTSLATRQENATYYLVCEYQSILSSGPRKMWYQTWLPFKPSNSSEKDKIYVVAGELEFCEVSEKDRIDAFGSRSKPK